MINLAELHESQNQLSTFTLSQNGRVMVTIKLMATSVKDSLFHLLKDCLTNYQKNGEGYPSQFTI